MRTTQTAHAFVKQTGNTKLIYGLAVTYPICRVPDFKMAAPINVLAFSRRYHRQEINPKVHREPAPVCSSNSNVVTILKRQT